VGFGVLAAASAFCAVARRLRARRRLKVKSSQVNTLPKAKRKTRSKQNKDMHKCSSVYGAYIPPLILFVPP